MKTAYLQGKNLTRWMTKQWILKVLRFNLPLGKIIFVEICLVNLSYNYHHFNEFTSSKSKNADILQKIHGYCVSRSKQTFFWSARVRYNQVRLYRRLSLFAVFGLAIHIQIFFWHVISSSRVARETWMQSYKTN